METVELVKKPIIKKEKEKPSVNEANIYEFSTSNLCLEVAILVFAGFMAYFLIMRSIGLHEVFNLRYVNAIFLIIGIALAMHSYKTHTKEIVPYKKGLQMGMLITLIAVIPFALFIYLYLNIDDDFLNLVEKNIEFKGYISPGTVACFIGLEGICSGLITTFIVMQFVKRRNKKSDNILMN